MSKRSFKTTAEGLFNAIEDPLILAKWWGPDGFSCDFKVFDFRKDGEWTFDMIGPDGNVYPNKNRFIEISKPERIVIRHEEAPLFTVALNMESRDDYAELTFSQKFDDPGILDSILHIIKPANEQLLNKLEKLL